MAGTYTYNPSEITFFGKDRMRFELGDVMVDGKERTCALCDEEYDAVLPSVIRTGRQWKKAKLRCLESIFMRFTYEPDTKVGPLSMSLGERAKLWKKMHDDLKAELGAGASDPEAIAMLAANPVFGKPTKPYFWNGMHSHEEAKGEDI